jgi:hypothetical protein
MHCCLNFASLAEKISKIQKKIVKLTLFDLFIGIKQQNSRKKGCKFSKIHLSSFTDVDNFVLKLNSTENEKLTLMQDATVSLHDTDNNKERQFRCASEERVQTFLT